MPIRLSLSTRVLLVSAVLLIVTGCGSSRPVYEYEYDSVYLKDLPVKDDRVAKPPITITLRLEQKANSLFIRSKIVAPGLLSHGRVQGRLLPSNSSLSQ
jgi:hypothetical protein